MENITAGNDDVPLITNVKKYNVKEVLKIEK